VGIADHGRQNKSMPLATFLPLLDNQQVDFVSLQLGTLPAELQGGYLRRRSAILPIPQPSSNSWIWSSASIPRWCTWPVHWANRCGC
jgi:hypothetical protein